MNEVMEVSPLAWYDFDQFPRIIMESAFHTKLIASRASQLQSVSRKRSHSQSCLRNIVSGQ